MSGVKEIVSGDHQAYTYSGSGAGLTNIPRAGLVAGTAGHVLINDGSGLVSSAAKVTPAQGGTGLDTTGQSGYLKVTNGTYSLDSSVGAATATAALGGTGVDSSASTGIAHVASGVWSFSQIVNADVATAAAVARSKLASGTAAHVVINDGSGVMSSEVTLAPVRGGTGMNTSASTGIAKVNTGNWSVAQIFNSDIATNAIIDRPKLATGTASHVLINDGSGVMSSEALLATTRGGTGINSSSATGTAKLSSGTWSFSQIVNADISASAAIARSKIVGGSVGHIVINGSDGLLSSEAQLATSRGGTGVDLSGVGAGPFLLTVANGTVSSNLMYDAAATNSTIAQRDSSGGLLANIITASRFIMSSNNTTAARYTATVNTTGITVTNLLTFTINAGTNGGFARAVIYVVYASKNGSTVSTANRVGACRLTLVGSTMTVSGFSNSLSDSDSALSTTSINVVASGANAVLQVAGLALTNITWMGHVEVISGFF